MSREVSLSCSAFLNSLQCRPEIFALPKCDVKVYLDNLQLFLFYLSYWLITLCGGCACRDKHIWWNSGITINEDSSYVWLKTLEKFILSSGEDLGSLQWYLRDRLDPCYIPRTSFWGLPLKVYQGRQDRVRARVRTEIPHLYVAVTLVLVVVCKVNTIPILMYSMGYQEDSYLWGRFAPLSRGGNPQVLSDSPDWPQGYIILYV